MTSLRKWRFPILIGSGLIAAGILFYYSNTHVSSDKTQGAIGQRDVYRDGQVNSADVATPGSAPVATTAILKSSEFKSLAKNPAFQQLLREDAFNELATRNDALVRLLADVNFRAVAQNERFALLLGSEALQTAVRSNQSLMVRDLSAALQQDALVMRLAESPAFNALLMNAQFRMIAADKLFDRLVESNALRSALLQPAFLALTMRSDFQNALQSGSAAQMMARSRQE
jgi:hypothetical protein